MAATETAREKALANYRKKLLEHRELDARLKESMSNMLLLILNDAGGTKMHDLLIHFHFSPVHKFWKAPCSFCFIYCEKGL